MRRFILFFAVLALLCGTVFAEAQSDDSFYAAHADQCEYVNRVYTTKESLAVYQSPESILMIGTAAEGAEILVTYIYTDPQGKQWGLCGQYEYPYGWFPMESLTPIFDAVAFQEANAHRIEAKSGQLDAAFTGKQAYFREYPESQRVRGTSTLFEGTMPAYSQVFTDEAGRQWGYVESYFGIKGGWLCLTDPQWVPEDQAQAEAPRDKGLSARPIAAALVLLTAGGFITVEILKRKRT